MRVINDKVSLPGITWMRCDGKGVSSLDAPEANREVDRELDQLF